MKNAILGTLIAAVLFFSGFLTRQCTFKLPEPVIKEIRDTTTYYDTSFFSGPKLSDLIVKRYPKDTIFFPAEPQIIHDSIYYTVPREEVEYRDSSFRAVVSGFLPRLEELEIYQKEKIITIQTEKTITIPKKTRFGVGVQAGYGITPAGFQPYLGLGISYNILSF